MSEQPGRLKREWRRFLGGLVAGLLALDMAVNGFFFGGSFNETISSRAGRTITASVLSRGLCVALNLVDPDHCAKAAANQGG